VRALEDRGNADLFRWDSLFLFPVNRSARDLRAALQDKSWQSQTRKVNLSEPNDALLIDNWQVLHGRSMVTDDGRQRHLQRVYLIEVFNDRITG
jgi:hypothetical protein